MLRRDMEESKININLDRNIGLVYMLGLTNHVILITDRNPEELGYLKQMQVPDIEIIGIDRFQGGSNYYSVLDGNNRISPGWYLFAKDLIKKSDIIIYDCNPKNQLLFGMLDKDALQMEDWIPGDLGYYPPLKVVLNLTDTHIDDQDALVYPTNRNHLEKILKDSESIRKIKRPNLDAEIELSVEEDLAMKYSQKNIDNTTYFFGLNKDDMYKMDDSERYVVVDLAVHCLDSLITEGINGALLRKMMCAGSVLRKHYIKHCGIIKREYNP